MTLYWEQWLFDDLVVEYPPCIQKDLVQILQHTELIRDVAGMIVKGDVGVGKMVDCMNLTYSIDLFIEIWQICENDIL